MMRRRRDQRHTRGRMAQTRDQAVHLDPRQLSALTRLGALRHLDFDFLAVVQIFRGDAKATGRDLLDCAGGVVTIFTQLESGRVFTPLA